MRDQLICLIVALCVGACAGCRKQDAACTEMTKLTEQEHALDEAWSARESERVAATSKESEAKFRLGSLADTLRAITARYGCDAERVCCKTAKSIDGLAEWASAFLGADTKDFVAAVTALGTASADQRATSCARVNAAIDGLERETKQRLEHQLADATADDQRAQAAQTAVKHDRAALVAKRESCM